MHRSSPSYNVQERVVFTSFHGLQTTPALTFTYHHDPSLEESYRIHIKKDYNIDIHYGCERSLQYAKDALKEKIQNNTLYYGWIEDGPRFSMRGIIEGFYGTPWSHNDRLDVISFLASEHMNTYMYAPKNDVYHRSKWREPYPEKELQKLLELIQQAKEQLVDFYFCISPGMDFNYTKEEDFQALYRKIDTIISYGVQHFCLLLDDIDYKLTGNDLDQFKTPGIAHAYISNQLYQHLLTHEQPMTLVMCPTEYWQNYDTPYRQDIKNHLDSNILVFWTGFNTIAEYIPNHDGKMVQEYFGHELVLWDNYPVNDMTRDLLFMGPLLNRGDRLDETHKGMVSNPMIEWSLSKLAILTMSEYMWNPASYDSEEAYQKALHKLCPNNELFDAFTRVLENFRHSIISYYKNETIEEWIDTLQISSLVAYYEQLLRDIIQLEQLEDARFKEQITPWFDRIKWDFELVQLMANSDIDKARQKLQELPQLTHTVGSNYAIKYAKRLGLYEGPIYKKQRINFWE